MSVYTQAQEGEQVPGRNASQRAEQRNLREQMRAV